MAKTPDSLRHAIDTGQTGGKVAFSDPSAAPLGTDEEAAGTPVSSHDVAKAEAHEIKRPKQVPGEASRSPNTVWIMVAAGVVLIAAVAIVLSR